MKVKLQWFSTFEPIAIKYQDIQAHSCILSINSVELSKHGTDFLYFSTCLIFISFLLLAPSSFSKCSKSLEAKMSVRMNHGVIDIHPAVLKGKDGNCHSLPESCTDDGVTS